MDACIHAVCTRHIHTKCTCIYHALNAPACFKYNITISELCVIMLIYYRLRMMLIRIGDERRRELEEHLSKLRDAIL